MFKKTLTSLLLTFIGVGGFFMHINMDQEKNFEWRHYFVSSISINQTYAADDCNWPNPPVPCLDAWQNAEIQKMLNTLVAAVNVMLGIVTIIVTPAIMLASWLMSPDWTAGDLFGIRPVMHSLWVTVSNITYLIYAILLIFIALATIFNSEHYGYKSMLPKLALGIILVPLTWWMVQFTVSLATYVTAAAVSVPAEALQKYTSDNTWWNTPMIPKKMSYKNGEAVDDKNNKIDNEYCKTASNCLKPSEVTMNAWGLYSPLLIYSFWVFKIQDIKKIDNASDVIKSIMQLINQWIIGVLMFLVFGILIMWLIFMLLMRAIKLWFYAIFSPLFTIKYVLGEKAFWDADKDGSFNITEFIWLAFVPAVVSLALSFGLIIIAGMTSPAPNDPNNKCEWEVCTITIMGNPQNTIVSSTKENISSTVVSMGWISYTFEWKTQWWAVVVPTLSSALSLTGNFFWTIILDIIALIFIWIAFMAGKGVSKAAGKAIEPFENMGNQIGKLGMSLPKYVPIPGTGGLSMKSMEKVPWMIQSGIDTRADKHFKEDTTIWRTLSQFGNSVSAGDLAKMKEAVYNYKWQDSAKYLSQALQTMHAENKWEKISSDHEAQKVMDKFAWMIKSWDVQEQHLKEVIKDPTIVKKVIEISKKDTLTEDDRNIIAAYMAWNKQESLNGAGAKDWLKDKKNAAATNDTKNTTINVENNWGDKFTFTGAWFNMKEKTKDEIMKELNAHPEAFIDIPESALNDMLKKMLKEDDLKPFLAKVNIEREKKKDNKK